MSAWRFRQLHIATMGVHVTLGLGKWNCFAEFKFQIAFNFIQMPSGKVYKSTSSPPKLWDNQQGRLSLLVQENDNWIQNWLRMGLATPPHKKNILPINTTTKTPSVVRLWFYTPQGSLMALRRRRGKYSHTYKRLLFKPR